jgi:P27 family predicted phage terminase small subunit
MNNKRTLTAPPLIKKDRVALHYWIETVPLLGDSVEKTDISILTNYCLSYATAMRMEYYLKENGRTTLSVNGCEVPRPEVSIARESWKDVRSCSDRLGLSPMARKKLKVESDGDNEIDDFEDL